MPGIGGLSIANNLLSNSVQLNLNSNQKALQTSVTRLSSGLRINTAADDPSGLAIAEKLQAQVNGFDRAAQNVQDANNAATVAEGALQTTTDILQRIRTLAVEAASDITSPSDKANLQTEVAQLLLEVNRISQNTQFNGLALLDGSHAGFQPQQAAFVTVESNAALASAGSGAGPLIPNGDFSGDTVPTNGFISGVPSGWTSTSTPADLGVANGNDGVSAALPAGQQTAFFTNTGDNISQTIQGLNPFQTYELTYSAATWQGAGTGLVGVSVNGSNVGTSGTLQAGTYQTFTTQTFTADAGGNATITFTAQSNEVNVTDIHLVGVDSATLVAQAAGVGANFSTTIGTAANGLAGVQGFTAQSTTAGYTVDGTIELQVINTGLSVAAQETFFNSTAVTSPVSVAGVLLAPNSFSTLFDNVQIITGNFTTADVGVTSYVKVSQNVAALSNPDNPAFNFQSGAVEGATIQVGLAATNTQTLRVSNINLLLSAAASPSLGAEDAIGQIDNALQNLLTQRANLGAVIVRLDEDEDNDNIASVNLQASESTIRDLNVGQETANFNRLQILVQVGTSVLSQSNSNAQSVLRLFP